MHVVPGLLVGKKVDLLLHSGGFSGPNFDGFLQLVKDLGIAERTGAAIVLANWSVEKTPWWQGWGLSRVIGRDGTLLARAENDLGDAVVIADVPLAAP